MPLPDAEPLAPGRVLSARYELLRPLTFGSPAEVWEGRDRVLVRQVAVKVLRGQGLDADFLERFRREAVTAARLIHPKVVATYDAGADGDVAYIVMELVRCPSLQDAFDGGGRVPVARMVGIARGLAEALDHAHRAGVVHGDVVPSNVLLCTEPAEIGPIQVKLAGFGVAGAEVEAADPRQDVRAVGAVLYQGLCGRPAPAGRPVGFDERPRRLVPGVPPDLEELILRALAAEAKSDTAAEAKSDTAAEAKSDTAAEAKLDTAAEAVMTMAELRAALEAVDVGPDDAAPMISSVDTPPVGATPVTRPRRSQPVHGSRFQGHWLVPALIGALVLVAVALVLGLVDRSQPKAVGPGRTAASLVPVRIVAVHSFDPDGDDGQENEGQAAQAADGNPTSVWTTSGYNNRSFGNLKPGVGLFVVLDGRRALHRLAVSSRTQGWAARVYLSDNPVDDLNGWGPPIAEATSIAGDVTFDLKGKSATRVLLWITDLGDGAPKVEVAELSVS